LITYKNLIILIKEVAMKKTKTFYLVIVLSVSALLLSAVNAGTVSEEAQRYMAQGVAAKDWTN